MVSQKWWCIFVILAATILILTPLYAQQSSVDWGFRERVRNTYMNNNQDFNEDSDDEYDFFRIRTNVWGSYSFSKFTAKLQLTNEFRSYTVLPEAKEGNFTFDEIIIDNLFVNWNSGGENPFSVTVGRQNLIYGEGFILLEGAPWDGSRAIYHDAVKLSLKRGPTTIDLLGISNTRKEKRLPVVQFGNLQNKPEGLPKDEDGDQWMNDGLEQALGLYAVHNCQTGARYDVYYFLKMTDPDPWIDFGAPEDKLTLNTIGGRAVYPFSSSLNLTTEWAYQIGSQGDFKQNSYGGYAYLSYLLNPENKAKLTGGFNLLSGDDPDTQDNEGWNPLFSRWPKWSELYIYSQVMETVQGAHKVAYWTNTFSPYLKFDMAISPKISLQACYYHLEALHKTHLWSPEPTPGTTRGDELQLLLKFNFMKGLTGHFLFDYFMPGNFYPEPRTDGVFIRGELMYTL